jgi:hypothetical protein
LAAWGEPSRPGFPRRGNGKGEFRFLAPDRPITATPHGGICRPASTPQVLTATQKPEFPVIFKKADKSLTAVIRNSRIELVCRAEGWTDSDASTAAAKTALMLLGVRRDSWKKCLDAASVLEKLTNGQQVFGNSVGNNWHVPVTVVALPTYDAH